MDLYEAIKKRASIREYKPDLVPEEKLRRILEAVRIAPSAKNIQPWRFIIINEPEQIQRLVPACNNQSFIAQAPLVIAGCALVKEAYGMMGGTMSSFTIDLAIAFDHLTLAATAEGLGTCWIGSFKEQEVSKILALPEGVRVVALTPLGYPNGERAYRPRKELKEIISYNRY